MNYHFKDMANTIHPSSATGGNTSQYVALPDDVKDEDVIYRIRKFTPRECFRLMGVRDVDIDKIQSATITQTLANGKVKTRLIPKTQLYKLAGNSIVVDVMYYIFKSMFVDEQPTQRSKQRTRNSLFRRRVIRHSIHH